MANNAVIIDDGARAGLVGRSAPMQQVKDEIRRAIEPERFARGAAPPLLLHGEHGTGKHLVARLVHAQGCRSGGPFVEVDCTCLTSKSLERELFGWEPGAFQGALDRRSGLLEAAEGGTLFLDEIGDIDRAVQSRLLQLVAARSFSRLGSLRQRDADVRIICTTSRSLEAMCDRGSFDAGLYSRLRVLSIGLPPLRSRGDDIVLLARHFLDLCGRAQAKRGLCLDEAAEQVLRDYRWPGNVRELRNTIERTVVLASGPVITPAHLALCPALGADAPLERQCAGCGDSCLGLPRDEEGLAQAVRIVTLEALQRTGWNAAQSAALLDLSPEMMLERMRRLDLRQPGAAAARPG